MEQVIYTKYSNGRGPAFAIRTSMVQEEDGSRVLYKEAEYPAGEAHIRQIARAAEDLKNSWADTQFQINQCSMEGKRIKLEFLKGHTLEEELDMLVEKGELSAAKEKILTILTYIRQTAGCKFHMTAEFTEVFGNQEIPEGIDAVNPADIDMIFQNMFLGETGSMHVIDYEWTFFFPVPVDFILYRALHYYLESASKRKKLKDFCDFFEKTGITPELQRIYGLMEQQFQQYIQDGFVSNGQLYHTMGKEALTLNNLTADRMRRRMQIYFNDGGGFREEYSYFLDQGYREEISEIIQIPTGTKEIWIDPVLSDCLLKQVRLTWESGAEVEFTVNGYELESGCFLFHHSDPKLMIAQIPEGEKRIHIFYRISILEHDMAEMLMDKVNATGRIKKKIRSFIKE